MSRRLNLIAQLVVVLAGALGMKFYYSTASVNQLRWILTPTTRLVEFVTGRTFAFESHAGYMSSDHTFLIAASCAGVNFFITAFLMLSLRGLWLAAMPENQKTSGLLNAGWIFLTFAAVFAYVATIVTNTMRISIALQTQHTRFSASWLNADQLHRIEGVLVYFGFLLVLFVVSERTIFRRKATNARKKKTVFGLLRPWLFPLMIYYAITLGLPLANGALRQGREFIDHSLVVITTPLLFILLIAMVRFGHSSLRRIRILLRHKGTGRRPTLGTRSEVIQTG